MGKLQIYILEGLAPRRVGFQSYDKYLLIKDIKLVTAIDILGKL